MAANSPDSTVAPRGGCASTGGRVVGTLFFGIFLAVGTVSMVFVGREVVNEAAPWTWRESPCTIVSSTVEDTGDTDAPYRADIRFTYPGPEGQLRSDRLRVAPVTSSSWAKLSRLVDRYPPGTETTCRVDPDDPTQAVLEASFPGSVLFMPIPLLFMAVGAGGVWFSLRRSRTTHSRQAPISGSARGAQLSRWIPLAFGGIFVLVGGGLFIGLGVIPVARMIDAASWSETECTIVSSEVASHQSDDGTTYSIDILFTYHYAGRDWRSNRYDFSSGSSGGYDGKRKVVDRYPPGSTATCYVDPDDPSSAVIDRSFRAAYLIGLFGLLFMAPGLAVMVWGSRWKSTGTPISADTIRRTVRRSQASTSSETTTRVAAQLGVSTVDDLTNPEAPRDLEPAIGPGLKAVGLGCAALFWNGIVSIFVWQAVVAWRSDSPDWGLNLFLIPFLLVGLGLIVGCIYSALATANPRPSLRVTPGSPRLGDSLRIEWRMDGRAQRLRRLEIVLVGQEVATYRRGTTTSTDREEFAKLLVVASDLGPEFARGSRDLQIPADTMHSFDAPSNKIVWFLKVSGDVPHWPDVSTDFPLHIRPLDPEQMR